MTQDPLVQIEQPEDLYAWEFDRYLEAGWTRSAQGFFRSKMLCLNGTVSGVVNIRLDLEHFAFSKSQRKRLSRVGRAFDVDEALLLAISDDADRLYQNHKARFDGFVVDSLDFYLYGSAYESIFNTRELTVHDGKRLIAASYFDTGTNSMMSQIGLHDLTYRKYGLGIYTMLREIEIAREEGLRYYYPGFVLSDPTLFDYKLQLGDFEYYDWNGTWRPLTGPPYQGMVSDPFMEKSRAFGRALEAAGLTARWYLYPLFTYSYNPEVTWPMCPAPGFFLLADSFYLAFPIAYYHPDEDRFIIEECTAAHYCEYSIIEPARKSQTPDYCHRVILSGDLIAAANSPDSVIRAYLS